MKLVLITVVSVSLLFEGTARGQGLPASLLDSPFPLRSVPAVIRGPARFQVLEAGLVRMEYAPAGVFVDAPSVSVINRDHWPQTAVQSSEVAGWLILKTDVLELRYKLDSGPFASNNLRLQWRDGSGSHEWRPGDVDGRIWAEPGELGNRSTKTGHGPGPLSKRVLPAR